MAVLWIHGHIEQWSTYGIGCFHQGLRSWPNRKTEGKSGHHRLHGAGTVEFGWKIPGDPVRLHRRSGSGRVGVAAGISIQCGLWTPILCGMAQRFQITRMIWSICLLLTHSFIQSQNYILICLLKRIYSLISPFAFTAASELANSTNA